MKSLQVAGIFLIPVLLAAALRFPGLAQRPMHCDEAVQADKFGTLLETGRYEYSSQEFHGPTLNYLTLLSARLQAAARYIDMDEITLRLVPASLGVLLVAAHFLLVPFLGVRATIAGALLAAVSPALVFYSRYYIHETLLVFFSYGALISIWRYVLKRRAGWAVTAGAFLGLMWATKETWVIAAVSLLLALPLALVFERSRDKTIAPARTLISTRHLVLAALAGMLVSGLFYSSFLSHPRGIVDSLTAYRTYLQRAVSGSWHTHPWNYYLSTLLYSHSSGGPVWTEGSIVGLAIFGFAGAMSRNGVNGVDKTMLRFIGFYTLLMVVIYSLIPYKTPWCLLGFLHGMVLLAGAGVVRLMSLSRNAVVRSLILSLLAAVTFHLGLQAWAASFPFDSDPRNPYVYAHTGKDVFVIAGRVENFARAHPLGHSMPMQIISRENLWPLPWYLRRFSAVRWWNGVPPHVASASLILASPDMEAALARKLYELPPPGERELYMNIFDRRVELRPGVELRGHAAKSLWDDHLQSDLQGLSPEEDR